MTTGWKAGGVSFPDAPIMIGAGVCKTPASARKWLKVAPVSTGSYTPAPREGNPGRVLWPETVEDMLATGYGLNAYGMPNVGIATAAVQLAEIETAQPLVVNIAGFSPNDYHDGFFAVHANENLSAVEFNFGCPNTQGEHPKIFSFDPDAVRETLELLPDHCYNKPVWLKFSPFSNPAELKQMAGVVNKFVDRLQLAVVTCNTLPNAYAGHGKIDTNFGMAGLSGPALKPIALGQVRQWRTYLDSSIDVIGVGGVTNGNDIVDFLEAGAAAVQITSLAHWAGDPRSFQERLFNEETSGRLLELLAKQ